MEIELKYRIPTPEVADDIWNDKLFFSYEEDGSREELCFMAKYFDTSDCDLAKHSIAYRVRKEGCRWVAALKWRSTYRYRMTDRILRCSVKARWEQSWRRS